MTPTIVLVRWLDPTTEPGWKEHAKTGLVMPEPVVSVGFLQNPEDPETVRFVMDLSPTHVNGVGALPIGCVMKRMLIPFPEGF